ncbi:DotU family type VI secretion system protein [Cognatazoarcus halotolerans]|uniref:DotU family type VI secretion system protein n=1 Tax=Cognatazoarcus halotolerans TaxID=2686016 RepID=UPI0013573593|nr:DotU family type VI secretion system protein [Cognatazoarcus halotolerans]MBX3679585.1 DotU family type VI secretion system protein [Rhodocyclaceae bacterium]MCB1899695.1 DotU family type VI secretion system protein [Rhodocyclaceae bacterium]MCP5309324.1 DotU family type VI secretion system protein [Zoogloeaceae bacterium]
MTTDDPFASPPGDRTLVIPNPGARAARPAPAPSTGAGSARIELAALDWGAGLNPLVAAANPLLGLVPHLRQAHHPDPAALRDTLARAVQAFETKAREAGVLNEHVIGARYALCTFLDETAANTPWGEKLWAQRSLLVQFHNEAWGGEKFFQLLGKLAEQPATHRNLLELFYIILALGFEGRYRVLQNGRAQLDAVRERLAQMIIKERGEPTRELSPHWQTLATNARPLRDSVPIWAVAAIAALLLATLYLASSYAVNRHSDPAFAQILGLRVPPPTPVAPVSSPAAPAVPAKVPDRLQHFLAAEIREGLVTVRDLPDRSVVQIQGDGLFEPASATLSPKVKDLMVRIGTAVAKVKGNVLVRGHSDNRPIRSARFPSNWHLSQARADSVAAALAPELGGQRIETEGRAESEPVASNDTPEGRAKNRRVEIIVFPAAGN